jgi:hypothetical protein
MILYRVYHYIKSEAQMKTEVKQYFNPDQHLTLHQDNEGNMIGGGYQVNNLLYQHKMPLFVSLDDSNHGQSGGGSGSGGHDHDEHFIPEKFSDLFRDLAVPAGLFMMPALFRPRNYAFEIPEAEPKAAADAEATNDKSESDSDSTDSTDSDTESERDRRKPVPKDIFDRLLELVTPSERVQHDVKTRRQRQHSKENRSNKKKTNTTKKARSYME